MTGVTTSFSDQESQVIVINDLAFLFGVDTLLFKLHIFAPLFYEHKLK